MAGIIAGAQKQKSITLNNSSDGKSQVTISEPDLEDMSHQDLSLLREYNLNNKDAQTMLAPYEHQAFTREATSENPLMAIPIALATPLYAAAKSIGAMTDASTTAPSLKQVGHGLKGVGQGIYESMMSKLNN